MTVPPRAGAPRKSREIPPWPYTRGDPRTGPGERLARETVWIVAGAGGARRLQVGPRMWPSRTHRRRSSTLAAAGWLVLAGCAGAACVALGRGVARGSTAAIDARLRRAARAFDRVPMRVLARIGGPLGKWYLYVPFALATSARLASAHRPRASALAVVGSAAFARIVSEAIELAAPHHEPPPGRGDPSVQSFPSGHMLEPLAVGLVSAVVLARERVASPGSTALALVSPALAGLGRLVLDRHWASDVAGGALAGVAVAGACLGAHALSG